MAFIWTNTLIIYLIRCVRLTGSYRTSLRCWHYWPWPRVDNHYTLHSLTRIGCPVNQSITATELNNVLISIELPEMLTVLLVSLASLLAVHCINGGINSCSCCCTVCLPAYIVIYLTALNWTSYSFGPYWSHGKVELYLCTPGHTGIWSYRDPLYTASCLMSAAAKRTLHRTA